MPDVEAFMGLAQLGLGLAGFSGIALALATRHREFEATDQELVRFLLLNSLSVSGLAVLPVAVGMLQLSPSVLWRGCSAFHLLGVLVVVWPVFGPRVLLAPPLFLWGMRFNILVVFLLQFFNIAGWLYSPSGGVYFAAVALILPGTAVAFARLLFEFIHRRAV